MYGAEGVKFFTRTKTVTAAWKEPGEGAGTLTGLGGVGVGRWFSGFQLRVRVVPTTGII